MKDEDLEKTKCLDEDMKELKEEKVDIHEEYKNMLRERKYSDIQEELDSEEESPTNEVLTLDGVNLDGEPKPPEETDTKNEDEESKEEGKKDKPIKKEGLFKKIVNKWKSLSKKKKIIICVVVAVVLISLIVGIVLVIKNTKKEDKVGTVLPEDVVVMKDNYIYKNGELIFLDGEDNEIGKYSCKVKDAEKCYVAFNRVDEDVINQPINVYEDGTTILNRMKIYKGSFAFVYDSEKEDGVVTLYDFKNEKEQEKFLLTKAYEVNDTDYIVGVDEEHNYKLYEITGSGIKAVFEKDYKYLGIIENKDPNYIIAKTSTGYYLLDYEGNEVSKLIGTSIFDYSKDYIVTVDENIYSLYDYNNNQKITGYRFLALEDDYLVLVDKDNKLYFRDNELKKMNEEGYNLSNDYYVARNVFTQDKVKTKSEFAFQNIYTDDKITVTISNQSQDDYTYVALNLNEINYSKTLKYYSYIDNKLHFYRDEDKEELIGSYACSNRNEDIKEGEMLSNCRPTLDVIYEDNDMGFDPDRVTMVPIINGRFVFIEDSTANNKTVKLFDLQKNSIIDTYESVNTYFPDNKGELTHANGNSFQVVAKKNGLFGTVVVGKDKASTEYSFSFKQMEKINGKILVQEKDTEKWSIIYSKSSTSTKFDGKIRGYLNNYFKIKKNDKYYIYDGDGIPLGESGVGYAYVELYKDMYAGVDSDNNLMLYDYKGNKLIDDKVKLYSKTYYGPSSSAFMIASNNDDIAISVLNDGSYESVNKKRIKVQESPKPSPSEPEEPDEEIEED